MTRPPGFPGNAPQEAVTTTSEKSVKSKSSRLLSYTNDDAWITPANERNFSANERNFSNGSNVQLTSSLTSKMSPVQAMPPPFRPSTTPGFNGLQQSNNMQLPAVPPSRPPFQNSTTP